MKKNFDAVDLAKLVASILIFAMHFSALSDFGNAYLFVEIICRWGVPFFFIASAFFLFSKSENGNISKQRLIDYVKRIFYLYLAWAIINVLNIVYLRIYTPGYTQLSTYLCFIRDIFISSTFSGSWFLVGCMFAAWLIYVLSKKLKTSVILALTFVLYAITAISSVYGNAVTGQISAVLDFLKFPWNIFTACFYFALGKYACERQEKLLSVFKRPLSIILAIVFFALFAGEVIVSFNLGFLRYTDVGFFVAPSAFMLFLVCLQSNIKLKNNIIMRKMSIIIYVSFGNLLLVRGFLKRIVGLTANLPLYLICFALSLLICFVVLQLQKKTNRRWVNYLT
ncbi:MAG: acyltransferase [Eggerthellaceae bacterium]|nr:acyltransferase [Eggerthellaceae bacterium]